MTNEVTVLPATVAQVIVKRVWRVIPETAVVVVPFGTTSSITFAGDPWLRSISQIVASAALHKRFVDPPAPRASTDAGCAMMKVDGEMTVTVVLTVGELPDELVQ